MKDARFETSSDVVRWLQSEAAGLWPALLGSLSFRRSPCVRENCPACDAVEPLIEIKDGELSIPEWGMEFDKPWLNEPNWEASPSMQHWKDISWRVQDDTERVLLERAIWLRETTGAKNLCMAGGVALNLSLIHI